MLISCQGMSTCMSVCPVENKSRLMEKHVFMRVHYKACINTPSKCIAGFPGYFLGCEIARYDKTAHCFIFSSFDFETGIPPTRGIHQEIKSGR